MPYVKMKVIKPKNDYFSNKIAKGIRVDRFSYYSRNCIDKVTNFRGAIS